MYSVSVRDHIMIAHSLPHPAFGPAAALHGATYVIDAEFRSPELNPANIVIDIGAAIEWLKDIAKQLSYKNLDDLPEFAGQITSTEFLARHIHGILAQKAAVNSGFQGVLKVTLNESHVAAAAYEGSVG